jgi:hypothetical protein
VLDVDGVLEVARLCTERVGEAFKLRFREEDIGAIAQAKGMGLVPAQIEIVSLYPLRAPVILALTDQSRAIATQHAPDDVWLHDAMRHVIGLRFATVNVSLDELPDRVRSDRDVIRHPDEVRRFGEDRLLR